MKASRLISARWALQQMSQDILASAGIAMKGKNLYFQTPSG
jgi:hypothetical protein